MSMELEENDESSPSSESLAGNNESRCCAGARRSLVHRKRGRCVNKQAMQSLYDLRQNNLLCDAVVRLEDGGVFPIHRAIVSACSNYFRTLFTTTLHAEEKTDFLLPNVGSAVMQQLLDYAYLHCLEVNRENVCRLLIAADYLCILGVLDLCCDYLRRHLLPENCVGIMIFAREHFCRSLEIEARRYILRNFAQVAEDSTEILQVSIDDLSYLIGEDELNVKNEETTWELVVRWIDHDPGERKVHVSELMRSVRLGLLDTKYFIESVKDNGYVAGNETCRPIVIDTLKFLYELETITQGKTMIPEIGRPRIPHEILFAIGGWMSDSATNYIETYDTRADRWVKVSQVDSFGPRAHHGAAVIGYNIYIIGGFDGQSFFSSCRCFNAVTKTWREVAPMNARRCYVSVATLNDMVYAMGGFDGYHRQSSAERFDYRRNQWSLIAPMNAQRSDADATTLNGKIYIAGGCNATGEFLSSVECYDPLTDQWTYVAPMRSRRSGLSCISNHGYVYVIGGFNGISNMVLGEKYNPRTNAWTRITDMYTPRSNFAIEIIDDMIFVIGGFNILCTNHVECYDEKTNEWFKAEDMLVYRSGLAACVITGLPNVYDYLHKNREQLMEEKRQKLLNFETQQRVRVQQQQQQQPPHQIHQQSGNNRNNVNRINAMNNRQNINQQPN